MRNRRRSRKQPLIVSLEGIHGVGKTTVFEILKRNRNSSKYRFYPERIAVRPIWPFGSEDKQTAFRSEVHFMQQMIERNERIQADMKRGFIDTAFLDRSPISVMVYSKSLELPAKDLEVLNDYYRSVNWMENVIIYLEAEPETIYGRIKKRESLFDNRKEWNEDDLDYIKRISKSYNFYFLRYENPVFRISTEDKSPKKVAEEIIKTIRLKFPKIPPPKGQELLDTWIK